ncbi:hypothetical protein [Alkalibaculum bacchi]|uniref:hypothetical protein n=1 Tax=Alkalibaculum bacchi TaxID=645887 RepID=UPI0026EB241A|nr:hypothetical protein [Alkalibaculum bacchi]
MDNDLILFVDDCFSVDTDRAVAILNKLHRSYGGTKKAFIEARISNIIGKGFLDKIPHSVLYGMQIGVECGYDQGLKAIKKGITVKQLYQGLHIIAKAGLSKIVNLSFIIGFPWESRDEIEKTLNTIEDIASRYNILCNLNWLMLLPSDLWKVRHKYGINVDESIYDDPLWMRNEDTFRKTHPRISDELFQYVDRRIQIMKLNYLKVVYNRVDIVKRKDSFLNRL